MLAFNLGVFFRNLQGEAVVFAADNGNCVFNFTGGVESLKETTHLNRELSVVLARDGLVCTIVMEEEEEPEGEENPEVRVRLVRSHDGQDELMLETTFRFNEIRLQPHSAPGEKSVKAPKH